MLNCQRPSASEPDSTPGGTAAPVALLDVSSRLLGGAWGTGMKPTAPMAAVCAVVPTVPVLVAAVRVSLIAPRPLRYAAGTGFAKFTVMLSSRDRWAAPPLTVMLLTAGGTMTVIDTV